METFIKILTFCGAILMAIGGILSRFAFRYRSTKRKNGESTGEYDKAIGYAGLALISGVVLLILGTVIQNRY